VRIEPFPYEPLQQWIDLAILNPGIEVHVLDDSRELDGVGCVAGRCLQRWLNSHVCWSGGMTVAIVYGSKRELRKYARGNYITLLDDSRELDGVGCVAGRCLQRGGENGSGSELVVTTGMAQFARLLEWRNDCRYRIRFEERA
jgi:hypothetical protein